MIVQKFGGIAMQSKSSRQHCILHIKKAIEQYKQVVVVVSAMGRAGEPYATDTLLKITNSFKYSSEAKDLAASCGELIAAAVLSAELSETNIKNTLLYGESLGIVTNNHFGDADILKVKTAHFHSAFQEATCIIVPGFQGVTETRKMTTLGRGGSDLTAVVIGAALNALVVEYFKDVDGVMTENPKNNAAATKIDSIGYDDFYELLDDYHPILQKKAVQIAHKNKLTLHIRNTFHDQTGTWIVPTPMSVKE